MDKSQNGQQKPDMEDWQLQHNTTMESLSFLLFNEIKSDIAFIVGSQHERIPAHKFILAIRSVVFNTMFYGMLSPETEVQIPDIQPLAFRNLLRYLYTDQVEIEPDSGIATLYAAKKYALPELEKRCEESLVSSLTPENAFFLLTQARFFEASHLAASCLKMIDKRTQACLDAKCFLDIDYDTLEVVLCRDTLQVREIGLYEAVVCWSLAECNRQELPVTPENQRLVLKDCLKLIRYPVMNNKEFAQGPTQNGLLTDKEIVHIFLNINSNAKPAGEFQDTPRRGIERYSEKYDRYGNRGYRY